MSQLRHRCQWCGARLTERYMKLWDGKWMCIAIRACTRRAPKAPT